MTRWITGFLLSAMRSLVRLSVVRLGAMWVPWDSNQSTRARSLIRVSVGRCDCLESEILFRDSEDSNQIARIARTVWFEFAECACVTIFILLFLLVCFVDLAEYVDKEGPVLIILAVCSRLHYSGFHKWAALCENVFFFWAYVDSEGPDQPAHPRSLIRALTAR